MRLLARAWPRPRAAAFTADMPGAVADTVGISDPRGAPLNELTVELGDRSTVRRGVVSSADMAVIIISVGAPPELARAVQSVLVQEPVPEIVVVNSGGGNLDARLADFEKSFTIVQTDQLWWVGAARNRGIEASNAPFVAFLAADCEAEPGWVSARLCRHRLGASAVASSVINNAPLNPIAWASHLAGFVRRLPSLQASRALRYGASYSRALFDRYGTFREDLRIGEDTEFHKRLSEADKPVWAPEVRTIHHASGRPLRALRDQFERGLRKGYFWPVETKASSVTQRSINSVSSMLPFVRRGLNGRDRLMAWISLPLLFILQLSYHLGYAHSIRLRERAEKAIETGDWQTALATYAELWHRLGDPEALRQRIKLLVGLARSDEAWSELERLPPSCAPSWGRALATTTYLSAHQQWEEIVALIAAHPPLIQAHDELLRMHLRALVALGRAEEGVALLEKRKATALAHTWLLVGTFLDAGQYAMARDRFLDLMSAKQAGTAPPALVAPLTIIAYQEGGNDLAQDFLGQITTTPSAKRRAHNQLLSVFQAERVRSFNQIGGTHPAISLPEHSIESQILRLNCPQAKDSTMAEFWTTVESFASLREQGRFFPDPLFVLGQAIEVAKLIIAAVQDGKPLSMVRIGDGEGNFLPYRPELLHFAEMDRLATQQAWWGRKAASEADEYELAAELRSAIDSANIIGLSDLYGIVMHMHNRNRSRLTSIDGKTARGLVAGIDYVIRNRADNRISRDQIITSRHLHTAFEFWGLWPFILKCPGCVSLITCHESLRTRLQTHYGTPVGRVFLIPPEWKYAVAYGASDAAAHFPERYHSLRDELQTIVPGEVVLVAAGMLGKIYASWVKRAGGVAIDVGSSADQWCGYRTRGWGSWNPARSQERVEELMERALQGGAN